MIIKLSTTELHFRYHSEDILKNFTLNVGDKQIVSIVGPNGSGKSTLIKCIDHILVPISGSVTVDRKEISGMKRLEIARKIAYVPQNSLRVFPNTVFDVVLMGRRPHLAWIEGIKDEKKVWEALQLLNIEDLALQSFNELSGGQQQKVLIARAIAQETGVILLDEPTSNLDMWHQIDVMEVLTELVKKKNITVVIAIHDLNIASRYSDLIIMMSSGKIVTSGKPQSVITEENLKKVYGIKANIKCVDAIPCIIPVARLPRPQQNIHSRIYSNNNKRSNNVL